LRFTLYPGLENILCYRANSRETLAPRTYQSQASPNSSRSSTFFLDASSAGAFASFSQQKKTLKRMRRGFALLRNLAFLTGVST
jgi:hypothetical protein